MKLKEMCYILIAAQNVSVEKARIDIQWHNSHVMSQNIIIINYYSVSYAFGPSNMAKKCDLVHDE